MRIFRDLELVEQLGSGMTRILKTNDTSIFKFMEHFMQVTFYFTDGFEEEPTIKSREKSREKILSLIKENPKITIREIAENLELTTKAIEKHIKNLKEDKIIERVGADKGGYWKILS